MTVPPGLILLLTSSGIGAEQLPPGELAVLPVIAPDLAAPAREALGNELRSAFIAAGSHVQAAEVTSRFLADARAAGLVCPPTERECAQRTAVAASVDVVAVLRVDIVGAHRSVTLDVIPIDGAARSVHGVLDGDAAALVRLLVDNTAAPLPVAVAVKLDPPTATLTVDGAEVGIENGHILVSPRAHHIVVRAPERASRTLDVVYTQNAPASPLDVTLGNASALPAIGITTSVVGGVLALGAGAFATYTEIDLADGVPFKELAARRTGGGVAVGLAVLGAAAVPVGLVIAAAGGPE